MNKNLALATARIMVMLATVTGIGFATSGHADAKVAHAKHSKVVKHHKPRLSQVKPGMGGSCARVAVTFKGNPCKF